MGQLAAPIHHDVVGTCTCGPTTACLLVTCPTWALTASMLFLCPLIAVQQQQPEQQQPEGWDSLLRRSLQAHELPDPSSLPSIVVRPQDWLKFVKYCPLCSSKCHMCAHCHEGKLKTRLLPLQSSSALAVAPSMQPGGGPVGPKCGAWTPS
jgi:hypothetical protein